jgi:hypothetical protein
MKRTQWQRLKGMYCRLFNHDWPTEHGALVVHEYGLLHCNRCREEFYGRTIADLIPLNLDDLSPAEQMDYWGQE